MILITGAKGQLGMELQNVFRERKVSFVALSHSELDITLEQSISAVFNLARPHRVVNCAAYTDVDGAESNRDKAFRVNSYGPGLLGRACEMYGADMIHISTDLCALPGKYGIYHESKMAGELNAEKHGAHIVRTSWLYSKYGAAFPMKILKRAITQDSIDVVEDQIGRPTWARRLAEFILLLIDCPHVPEIFHFANSGIASRYDFAHSTVELAREYGILKGQKTVLPTHTDKAISGAPRPMESIMDLSTAREIMTEIPHWRDDLREFMKDLGTI